MSFSDNFSSESAASMFIRITCRKLNCLETVYAGLIVFFVPSVLSEPDWSRPLTYDKIYNSTQYAQLQYISRPLNTQVISNNLVYKHNLDDTNVNEVDNTVRNKNSEGKLLVGFARDPFRYSVPEEDYARGIRYVDPEPYKGDNRGKRGVFHLYNMIYCATGCEPLSYKGYGCYCGFLGAGRPTDGIDSCCKMHDQCYEDIYCPFYTVYLQPYYWKCYYGQPLCALENHKPRNQLVNRCAARLCECDRLFAMCVKRYQCPRKQSYCRSSPVRLLQNLLRFR